MAGQRQPDRAQPNGQTCWPLSFGVTYWDQLGWKDTFAKPAIHRPPMGLCASPAPRQRLHPAGGGQRPPRWRGRPVPGEIEQLMQRAERRGRRAPMVKISPAGRSRSGAALAARQGRFDVWLVRYDPRIVQVAIRRGENGGRTLPHRNVVRELVRLGGWNGQADALQPARQLLIRALRSRRAGSDRRRGADPCRRHGVNP